MKVRTSAGALATVAILSGALAVAAVGDGHSSKDPAGATIVISPPDPVSSAPAVTSRRDGAPAGASQPAPRSAPDGDFHSPPDAYVPIFLRGGLTCFAIFLLAHLALRRAKVSARWAYAGIGALSAAIAVASVTPPWSWRTLIHDGRLSEVFGIVAAFGAMIGFIYAWRAGLSEAGDDPAALARALQARPGGPPAAAGAGPDATVSDDAALVAVDQTEYFDGPLQVRTSFPVMLVAAVVSTGLYCAALAVFGVASEQAAKLHASLPFLSEIGGASEMKAVLILATGLITAFPATFLILFTHWALRGLNKSSYPAYAAGGFLAPASLGLLLGPVGLLLGLQVSVPMAISMAVYRNMAGVEPKPLKEDIFVRDRRRLVGADHARRRYGRVVSS